MVVPNCLHERRDSAHSGDRKCIYHFSPLAQCAVEDVVLSLTIFATADVRRHGSTKQLESTCGPSNWIGLSSVDSLTKRKITNQTTTCYFVWRIFLWRFTFQVHFVSTYARLSMCSGLFISYLSYIRAAWYLKLN